VAARGKCTVNKRFVKSAAGGDPVEAACAMILANLNGKDTKTFE
jgi:hypothetical protein